MNENQLAENIAYYRKQKGLSQEKVAEYMGVSRQAVTKWESNTSRPSSDNLILLAQLFDISVDTLLGNKGEMKSATQTKISTGKMPWFLIGISVLCVFAYIIKSTQSGILSTGVLICMFVLCVPIQMFLHIYFTSAINNNSFNGIAGFNDKVKYDMCEVKKLLVQINLHIGIMSTVYIFLFCVANCTNSQTKWLNGFLIAAYLSEFIITLLVTNYRMIDKVYREDIEKKRAKQSMPITAMYCLLLFIGIGIMISVFEIKGIENNTLPALKLAGLLVLGTIIATIGFMRENKRIKKWNPASIDYKIGKASIVNLCICVMIYVIMCFI